MKRIFFLSVILCAFLGCTSHDSDSKGPSADNDTLQTGKVTFPEGIRKPENLTVYASLDSPRYEIKMVKDQTFSSPRNLPFHVDDQIAVGDSGMVFIEDGVNIFVYDREGQYLTTMGGKGRGPGELSGFAKKEMIIQGNRLFIYDDIQYRINIFSLEAFRPVGAINMNPQKLKKLDSKDRVLWGSTVLHVSLYYPFKDSLLLVRFNGPRPSEIRKQAGSSVKKYKTYKRPSYYYLLNRKGEIVSDRIFEAPYKLKVIGKVAGGSPLQFESRFIMEVGPKGYIYTANTKDFLIKVYHPDGSYDRAIFYPFKKIPFDGERFINTYRIKGKVRQILHSAKFPDYWPVLTDMFVDDEQRIWVATFTGNAKRYKWHVLDEKGQNLATFNWPAHDFYRSPDTRGSLRTVKGGYMYVFQETPDKDSSTYGNFVRYKIEFNPQPQ